MTDFFDALNNSNYYLAETFYTAVGIVATLVIIIIIMAIGYCYFARYLVKRNRLMNRKLKLLTSPQDNEDDIIELKVNNTTLKPGSVDPHSGEEDNVNDKQQLILSQENVANQMSSKDMTPLIQEKDGEIPNKNPTMDAAEQEKNIPEGMYATVNKDNQIENGVAHDNNITVTADVTPSTGHGITVSDGDYAEVKCEHSMSYQYPPDVTTKDRSRTLPCTAMVDIDLENEDYSRLVHDTQANPRHSMPLLSDYSRIGIGGAKWRSLEMELDQNQNQNEDLYATPNPQTRSNRDNRNGAEYCDSPSPLPTPVVDDPDKVSGPPGSLQESRKPSQKQGKETDKDNMALDTAPKGESPPPLPPPFLDGELEEASEALYDEAITNHYQNVSSCIESGGGNVAMDGSGGLNDYSKVADILGKENAGIMNTGDLQEGIYDSIDQEAD